MSPSDASELRAAFFEESKEHLAAMEGGLLALESTPDDRELVNQIFRGAHSIKGASGFFGFTDVQRLTHALENLLHELRDGGTSLTSGLSDLLLRATDLLRAVLHTVENAAPRPENLDLLLREIDTAIRDTRARGRSQTPVAKNYRVVFVPGRELLREGMDPLMVLRELLALGEVIEASVDASALPSLDALDLESSYLGWILTIRSERTAEQIRDVFAFVEDSSRVEIGVLAELDRAAPVDPEPTLEPPNLAVVPQDDEASPQGKRVSNAARSTIRVDSEKIDKLIDLVGELTIAHSMITDGVEHASTDGVERLRSALAVAQRNLAELQYRVLSVRMVPVGTVFARFPRLVRDAAGSLGKEIELVLEGKDAEIDKEMVEKLADPLTHLVRNAIDHGIELPSERRARGKASAGTVIVRARHQGGNLVVEVIDDGNGLPTDKIRAKARMLGLIAPEAELDDDQVHVLIFAPGFSTAGEVSELSGRGVGMDVVKRNVEALNGSIVLTSEAGRGCRVELRLPISLGIMDGLVLRVGSQTFVVPLNAVIELVRPNSRQVRNVLGRGEVVSIRDRTFPLVRLHGVFRIRGAETKPERALVCIVEADPTPFALLVDELLSHSQIVLKSLEKHFRRVEGVMAATILGDGNVALILDVPALLRMGTRTLEQEEAHRDAS
jgi:two-component system, chemotaxis family, sensor kinase CheA